MSDPRPWDLVVEWRQDANRLEREAHKAVRVDEWTLARAECKRDDADQLEAAIRGMAGDWTKEAEAWSTNKLQERDVLDQCARELLTTSGEGGRDG